MEYIKRSPVIIFALCGFFLSLGAPLGYYVHDFLFNNPTNMSFADRVFWIHQHELSTILYIGVANNLFFTLFGALLGHLLERAFIQEGKMLHLKRSKKDLLVQSLNRMREPTSIGIESLMCLKRDHLKEEDKLNLIESAIQELQEIDTALQDLLQMESNQRISTPIPSEQVVDLVEKVSEKNDIKLPAANPTQPAPIHVHVPERPLSQAIDRVFKWLKKNELTVESVSYLHQAEMFQLHIVLAGNCEDHDLDDALLIALIEYGEGRCFINGNTIHLCLPATVKKEKVA